MLPNDRFRLAKKKKKNLMENDLPKNNTTYRIHNNLVLPEKKKGWLSSIYVNLKVSDVRRCGPVGAFTISLISREHTVRNQVVMVRMGTN
ncbi:hypothetical protein CDAR_81011 [Caerostris darwini]|uniref:Ribosomal protein S19 n=1 Tax=Caerostris darwini TaxID=1538125 RepID=A0AAV4SD51_9ARAC|nr:hypothetical protein CDAR_81011 [Caerostris darwini]